MSLLALIIVLLLFGLLYFLQKRGASFLVRVLTATILGIIVGLIFEGQTEYVGAIGKIYANLLKAMVVPILLFSVSSTIASLEDTSTLSSIGVKTIGVLGLHNILGSIIAIAISILFRVGNGLSMEVPTNVETREVPNLIDTIVGFFPSNIAEHAASNQVVPVIIFAALMGFAILFYQNKSEIQPFINFLDAGSKVVFKLVGMIVKFTPYAVLALIANAVSGLDVASFGPLVVVLAAVWVASFFHSFITTAAMVGGLGKINPIIFIKKFFSVWMIGFTTQSSTGAIPANIEAQKKMGVSEDVASFAATIGSTFGMPGCAAIWPVILTIFSANVLGITFSISDYFILILVAVLVSAGSVGVPGAATIAATGVFTAMGLPVEMIIIMTPISAIADMARTATNVQAAGSTGVIVAASEGKLDMDLYNAEVQPAIEELDPVQAEIN